VSDESVMVDFNHPLAGRSLAFRVEILKVSAQAPAN
jgi:FKBP-type peptidyl-prolyl cis-trans isomerase 2